MTVRGFTHPLRAGLLAIALGAAATCAQAVDYRSVTSPAILYDSPSAQGKRLFIIAGGTPVELIVALDKWYKVRDSAGTISWIERNALSERRTLQVSVERAVVRSAPEERAPMAFEAVRDVILDLIEMPKAGWIKVRHRDGATGYIHVSQVWGV